MNNNATKTLFDNGQVRMLVDDHNIVVEELPRKPCKKTLRRTSINTHYAVCVMWKDAFIPANILREVPLDPVDTYDTIVVLLEGKLVSLYKEPGNEQVRAIHGVTVHKDERYYLEVAPEGSEKQTITCADFVLELSWTKFSAYSPNSDFQQADPHYTQIHQSSAGAARKLFGLVQKKQDAVAKLTWDAFSAWLKDQKVGYEYSFSQWT